MRDAPPIANGRERLCDRYTSQCGLVSKPVSAAHPSFCKSCNRLGVCALCKFICLSNNTMQQSHYQQRRVFRGRGRPTDGNIPPKKTTRPKVKYQGAEAAEENEDKRCEHHDDMRRDINANEAVAVNINNIQQLSLDTDTEPPPPQEVAEKSKLHLEIEHLQKRINNIQTSIQTSSGITNPTKWKSNCLLSTRNVVKEWVSILKFHIAHSCNNNNNNNNDTRHEDEEGSNALSSIINHINTDESGHSCNNDSLLHSTSQMVFGLIQMSMQTGPLVGSNPGYFKRCGGEVASIAYEYLNEIIELASGVYDGGANNCNAFATCNTDGVDDKVCDSNRNQDGGHSASIGDSHHIEESNVKADSVEDVVSEGSQHVDEDMSDSDSSSSLVPDDNIVDANGAPIDIDISSVASGHSSPSTDMGDQSNTTQQNHHDDGVTSQNLQTNLLFTEKQSQRLIQWVHNAEKAMNKNKPRSKSATKLQHQKSKKQKHKELKMERKLKKKSKNKRK